MVTGYSLIIADLNTGDLKKINILQDWQRIPKMNFSPDSYTLAVSNSSNSESELCTSVAIWNMEENLLNNLSFDNETTYDAVTFSQESNYLMAFHQYPCWNKGEDLDLKVFD